MKINQDALKKIAALPDKELWAQIVSIAKERGFNLPEKTPSHAELEKIRQITSGPKISISDAVRLLNEYKRRG